MTEHHWQVISVEDGAYGPILYKQCQRCQLTWEHMPGDRADDWPIELCKFDTQPIEGTFA